MVCEKCGAIKCELGHEPTPALFIEHLVSIFDEVGRVLRPDGVVFCNLGDSYAGSGKGPSGKNGIGDQSQRQGFTDEHKYVGVKAKSLLLIPERFAIAMQDAGWIVRSRICWAKSSAMPESVRDRPTSAWEHIWMFTKQARYFYDADAVRQPTMHPSLVGKSQKVSYHDATAMRGDGDRVIDRSDGANLRNYWLLKEAAERLSPEWNEQQQEYAQQALAQVWQKLITEQPDVLDAPLWLLGPEPSREQHYAAFPSEIPRRCILAATSERGQCPACGAPWTRITEKQVAQRHDYDRYQPASVVEHMASRGSGGNVGGTLATVARHSTKTLGWASQCGCNAGPPVPQLVLDPFLGSGTTALVADQLGRNAIGIELNPTYAEMARKRITNDCPMFVDVEVAG